MRRSIIIFTLGWLAAWGGGLGAHTPPSSRTAWLLAGGEDGTQILVGQYLVILPREYARASSPATSLTQQAAPLCGVPGWSSEIHGDCDCDTSLPPHPRPSHANEGPIWLPPPAWAHPGEGLV